MLSVLNNPRSASSLPPNRGSTQSHRAESWQNISSGPLKVSPLRLICYQPIGPLSQPGWNIPDCSLRKAFVWGVDLLFQDALLWSAVFVSQADSWKSSRAAGARTPLKFCYCGPDTTPGENNQPQWNEMRVECMDFVGNIGKGNDSKSGSKPIILKGLLPADEVYGVLWLPPGSCGAPAVQSRGDRPPTPPSRWIGNRIQCDDRPAL